MTEHTVLITTSTFKNTSEDALKLKHEKKTKKHAKIKRSFCNADNKCVGARRTGIASRHVKVIKYTRICMAEYSQHPWTLNASNGFATYLSCNDISIDLRTENGGYLINNHQESVVWLTKKAFGSFFRRHKSPRRRFVYPACCCTTSFMHSLCGGMDLRPRERAAEWPVRHMFRSRGFPRESRLK